MSFESTFQSRAVRLALSPLLAPAALFYLVGLSLDRRRRSARRTSLRGPVISVGNLTVGGTGKTPVVLRLAEDLVGMKLRTAVLTRGYAGAGRTSREGTVLPGARTGGFSDEVMLMAKKRPEIAIGVGADRAVGAQKLMGAFRPDVFILDDGFQQWGLARDLDIVCVDASRPWERYVLPLGTLREPAKGLVRANVIVLTRCELVDETAIAAIEEQVRAWAPGAAILRTSFSLRLVDPDGSLVPPSSGSCVALSAIGNPDGFETSLRKMGLDPVGRRFPDHHAYVDSELAAVAGESKRHGAPVVTTEKDWVKLRGTRWLRRGERPPLFVAEQHLVFHGEGEAIWQIALENILQPRE